MKLKMLLILKLKNIQKIWINLKNMKNKSKNMI